MVGPIRFDGGINRFEIVDASFLFLRGAVDRRAQRVGFGISGCAANEGAARKNQNPRCETEEYLRDDKPPAMRSLRRDAKQTLGGGCLYGTL